MTTPSYEGYKIVNTIVARDSLNRSSMHISKLANGMVRIVHVVPDKSGIDTHYVFELIPEGLKP